MIISFKHKFIFIKTYRTESTNVEILLSKICGENDILTPILIPIKNYHSRNYENFYEYMSAKLIKSKLSENIWNNFFKFCIDRNPWDYVASSFLIQKEIFKNKITFDKFIKQKKFIHNCYLYIDNDQRIIVDKILKYENLQEEIEQIFKQLNIFVKYDFEKKHRNKKPYYNFYSEKQKKLIEEEFSWEIENLKYQFK